MPGVRKTLDLDVPLLLFPRPQASSLAATQTPRAVFQTDL